MQKCPRPPAIRLDRVHAVPNSPRVSDAIATVNRIADAEIAAAIRLILSTTHHLVEGAGAVGMAAAVKLRDQLRGQRACVVFSGSNLDSGVLRRILNREL